MCEVAGFPCQVEHEREVDRAESRLIVAETTCACLGDGLDETLLGRREQRVAVVDLDSGHVCHTSLQ